MKLGRIRRMDARIPTASMADIAFLLIIFFMVTTVHEVDRTPVSLPLSVVREDTEKGSPYVVVHKEGDSGMIVYKFSDGEDVSRDLGGPSDLYLEASRLAHMDPNQQFVIKADGDIRYLLIDEVLDQLRKAGVQRLLLLTMQKGAPPGSST